MRLPDYMDFFVWGYRDGEEPSRWTYKSVIEVSRYGQGATTAWFRGFVAVHVSRLYGVDLSGGEA